MASPHTSRVHTSPHTSPHSHHPRQLKARSEVQEDLNELNGLVSDRKVSHLLTHFPTPSRPPGSTRRAMRWSRT